MIKDLCLLESLFFETKAGTMHVSRIKQSLLRQRIDESSHWDRKSFPFGWSQTSWVQILSLQWMTSGRLPNISLTQFPQQYKDFNNRTYHKVIVKLYIKLLEQQVECFKLLCIPGKIKNDSEVSFFLSFLCLIVRSIQDLSSAFWFLNSVLCLICLNYVQDT